MPIVIALGWTVLLSPSSAVAGQDGTCYLITPTIRGGPGGLRGAAIEVSSPSGCFPAHAVSSSADLVMPWIPPPSVLPLSVAENASGVTRTAVISFDGRPVVTVTQGTSSCVTAVIPTAVTVSANPGQVVFDVEALAPDC